MPGEEFKSPPFSPTSERQQTPWNAAASQQGHGGEAWGPRRGGLGPAAGPPADCCASPPRPASHNGAPGPAPGRGRQGALPPPQSSARLGEATAQRSHGPALRTARKPSLLRCNLPGGPALQQQAEIKFSAKPSLKHNQPFGPLLWKKKHSFVLTVKTSG